MATTRAKPSSDQPTFGGPERERLDVQTGLRGAALDEAIERFGGELLYQYTQDAELRHALAARRGSTASARSARTQPYDLHRTSSRALRDALDPPARRAPAA